MLVLIALVIALLQQPPQTGTIEGMVVRRGTTFPVAGVQITATTDSPTALETVTDGAGRFILREVPPGRVTIEASADGYLFFQRISGDRVALSNNNLRTPSGYDFPNPVLRFTETLTAGESLKLAAISATAAAAISGRVVDNDGRGIPNVTVAFSTAITDAAGTPQFVTVIGAATTDEKGQYRRDMLGPGDYRVKATLDRPDAAPLAVYYPATADARLAAPVIVGEGTEATANIEISAAPDGTTFKISGHVLQPPTKSASSSVGLLLKTQNSPSTAVANTSAHENTGNFELRGIRPGNYDLFASANIDDKEYLTRIPIEIRDRDIQDVKVLLQPGAEIKGRLVIVGASDDLQLARSGIGSIRIALSRKDGLFGDILRPAVDDAGAAFTFSDVPPGLYDLTVRFVSDRDRMPGPDLYVADIRASGRSVFDSGFEVGVDPTDAMEVLVGTDGGSISGTVLAVAPKQRPLIILAPEFSRRGNASLFRAVEVNADGQFQLRGLTPGTYEIFAVPASTPLFSRSEFLSQYESRAVTVVVQRGLPNNGIKVPLLSSGK